jgi:acyl-CoA hydrolase
VSDHDLRLSSDEIRVAMAIKPFLKRGCLVAIADGAGSPVGLGRPLAYAAQLVGGIRLVVGWSLQTPVPIECDGFTDVRVLVGGYGLRGAMREPHVHYVPVRLSSIPALLHTVLRPDVLLAGVRHVNGGLGFGTEVSWMRSVVELGVPVVAELNDSLPAAAADDPIPANQVVVVSEVERAPCELPVPGATAEVARIGAHAASLVTPDSVVQYGPGSVGDAAVRSLNVPVRVHSGIATDAIVDLDARGHLVDEAVAAYVVGTPEFYAWADGRPMACRIEKTHDLSYLSDLPMFAINTALEIDLTGQVNVEGFGPNVVAGVGGHPDFAAAGSRARDGLSIAALPTLRGRHRTLVRDLAAPASTARCDIDVVVTEFGVADLRGLDDAERGEALMAVWDYDPRDGSMSTSQPPAVANRGPGPGAGQASLRTSAPGEAASDLPMNK